jgi:hypothetical protein
VRDIGALVQAGPYAHHQFAARAGDPALPVQVRDIDVVAPGERMIGRNRHAQSAFGEHLEQQGGRLRVRRPVRRRGGQHRQIDRPRAQGTHEARCARLAADHCDPRRGPPHLGQGWGHEPASGTGEPAQSHRRTLLRHPRQFPCGGLDLVDHHGGAAGHHLTGRCRPQAVVAALEQRGARRPLQGGDLPRRSRPSEPWPLAAVCPGMMNTPTSAMWWDVSTAPAPAEAATVLLDLAQCGELVRAGKVLPWKP